MEIRKSLISKAITNHLLATLATVKDNQDNDAANPDISKSKGLTEAKWQRRNDLKARLFSIRR